MISSSQQLVLASSSPFRRELLDRLQLDYQCYSPDIDESPKTDERPEALVRRLSQAKSEAVRAHFPTALIIGSDQVAVNGETILGKPGDFVTAKLQLQAASGRQVEFLTGLCLLNAKTGTTHVECIPFNVCFRELTESSIENYLTAEEPYNCAGSFKSEGLGVALFERMSGDDPTALIGLPLIRLCQLLLAEGVDVLASSASSQN